MNRKIDIALLLSLAVVIHCLLPSCAGAHDAEMDGYHRALSKDSGKVFRVALTPGGDFIKESEEPLFRAGGKPTDKTYMGINVERKPIDNPTAATEKYAYGVFSDIDNIYIDLVGGYLYDFKTTIIRKKNDVLALYDNNSYQYLRQPFRVINRTMDTPSGYYVDEVGSFKYTYSESEERKKMYLYELSSGTAYAINSNYDQYLAMPFAYPRVDRFYGEIKDVNPSGIDHIDVDLAYKCFGLRIEVVGMPEGSWLKCKHYLSGLQSHQDSDYLQFPENFVIRSSDADKTWEDVYSLPDMTADEQDLTLEFQYFLSESDFKTVTKTFVIKPKMKKILQISMEPWINKLEGIKINLIEDEDTSLDSDTESVTLN